MTISKADLGDGGQPLNRLTFRCSLCRRGWEGAPDEVVDAPEQDWHPWRYYADCPNCGTRNAQADYERRLLKMWAVGTPGPTSAEGKARSAENLKAAHAGDHSISRFNAMKHGIYAQQRMFFPAKPGIYPHCENCEYLHNGCETGMPCQKRAELFFRHFLAVENNDPRLLNPLNAQLQANIRALTDDMILDIIRRGVTLEAPKTSMDKDGFWHTAQYEDDDGNVHHIKDVFAHPLLKILGEWLNKNAMSLADMGLTAKAQDEKQEQMGRLAQQESAKENLLEYQARQTAALEGLSVLIERSREKTAADPVLVEYQQGESQEE